MNRLRAMMDISRRNMQVNIVALNSSASLMAYMYIIITGTCIHVSTMLGAWYVMYACLPHKDSHQ